MVEKSIFGLFHRGFGIFRDVYGLKSCQYWYLMANIWFLHLNNNYKPYYNLVLPYLHLKLTLHMVENYKNHVFYGHVFRWWCKDLMPTRLVGRWECILETDESPIPFPLLPRQNHLVWYLRTQGVGPKAAHFHCWAWIMVWAGRGSTFETHQGQSRWRLLSRYIGSLCCPSSTITGWTIS